MCFLQVSEYGTKVLLRANVGKKGGNYVMCYPPSALRGKLVLLVVVPRRRERESSFPALPNGV